MQTRVRNGSLFTALSVLTVESNHALCTINGVSPVRQSESNGDPKPCRNTAFMFSTSPCSAIIKIRAVRLSIRGILRLISIPCVTDQRAVNKNARASSHVGKRYITKALGLERCRHFELSHSGVTQGRPQYPRNKMPRNRSIRVGLLRV